MAGEQPTFSYFGWLENESAEERRQIARDKQERHREASDEEIQRAFQSTIRSAAYLGVQKTGIDVKHMVPVAVERDDDRTPGGYWVPMWIFVPGGNNERPENSS